MLPRLARSGAARAALIALATFAAYAPALRAGFVFDDHAFLLESDLLRGSLSGIWLGTAAPDYWPLTWTSLWVEWRAWGAHAAGYHATNLLLHAAAGVLLWRALDALRVPGAFLAGLLFVVHPVTVESAAWISERKNTLSAALLLGAALAWIRFDGSERRRDGVIACSLFVLALLSKTSIVLAPFALLAISILRRGRPARGAVAAFGVCLAASAAAGIVTVWFQRTNPMALWALPHRGALERLGGAGWALASYLQQAFLPVGLGFVYADWPVSPRSLVFFAPLAGLALAAAGLWRVRRAWGRPILLALGFHLLMVLPVLGLVDMAYLKLGPISNHLQYVALMGPVALVAAGAAALAARFARAVPAAAAVAVATLGIATFQRSSAFADDLTLWREAVRAAPRSAVARLELAGQLLAAGEKDQALPELEAAARVAPDPARRHRALAFLALYRDRPDEALAEARLAAGASDDPLLRRDLGVLLVQTGRSPEAVEVLRPLVAASPGDGDFAAWLATALESTGRADEAASVLADASRRRPGQPALEERLATLLARQGRLEDARGHLAAALGLPADDPRVSASLAELVRGGREVAR